MHKWLISVCFFLLNLNFVSPTSVKTPPFDLKQYHPPSAPGSCSCVQSDNQFVKKFKFDQYSSCGFQSGDPWPYCIVDVKGDCPSKLQTSIPNVFYIPCERHHVDMTETCTDCETCAPQDHSGKFQVLTRTYGVNDSACASLCLKETRCTFSSFSAGECSLFSNCTDRDSNTKATSLRKKVVVVTNHTQDGIPDATPKDFRYEEGVDLLNDCLCRQEWANPRGWEQCGAQNACASDSCLGGNWCQVANPPCKYQFNYQFERDKIAWAKCTNETQVEEPTNICKCKAKWSLPDKLGKDCVDQRGCSYSEKCRAKKGFGMCDFEEDGCTWPSAPMPCGDDTPVAPPAPEDAEECKCKEKWEYIGVDPHCVNQQGCATMDCLGGNWCIVENPGCRTQINENQPFAFCSSEKVDPCNSKQPNQINFELRYDKNKNTLSTTALQWKDERIMDGKINFQNLGRGGMLLFSTDASDAEFSMDDLKKSIFNSATSYIRCPEDQDCTGGYVVNIKSKSGFQIIYLRFITPDKLKNAQAAYERYAVQCQHINKCTLDKSIHAHLGIDSFPPSQYPYVGPFYTTKAPVAMPSYQRPGETKPGDIPLLNWQYLWQVLLIGILAFIIFLLFLGIHNLDSCCDSLAEHMFEASSMGDSLLAPGEFQSQQFTEELLLGHHEITGEDPICLSEPGNWEEDFMESPEEVTVQLEDENEI